MALKSYQGVALDLLAPGEFVVVTTTGGTLLKGTVMEAKPSLLRLAQTLHGSDMEHLINPFQIAAITVKVVEA